MLIGQGGFGSVVVEKNKPTIAHKLMKNHVVCKKAQIEFENHRKIYEMYRAFISDTMHRQWRGLLAVPEPYVLLDCSKCKYRSNECTNPCTHEYHCAFSMERVKSYRRDSLAEHVLLDGESQGYSKQLWFVKPDKNGSVSMRNNTNVNNALEGTRSRGPRGSFIGLDALARKGLNPLNMAVLMGILYELVIAAGLQPQDIEYVLGKSPVQGQKHCLWIMDFGMVDEPYDETGDMYTPKDPAMYIEPKPIQELQTDVKLFENFVRGRHVVQQWAIRASRHRGQGVMRSQSFRGR